MSGKTRARSYVHTYPPAQEQRTTGSMSSNQLIFVGVGGIIGAGFFLGAGLPIRLTGPSVLIAFVIGAVITGHVVGAITSVAVSHPVQGSFKTHADMFIGPFAGYMQGWILFGQHFNDIE